MSSPLTNVRWKYGKPREVRLFPPLPVDHPAAGAPCLVCGINLFGGIDTPRDLVLLALGPGPEEREEKGNGADRWYSAVALLLHASCAIPGHAEGSVPQASRPGARS
jgi:hypothetical protein